MIFIAIYINISYIYTYACSQISPSTPIEHGRFEHSLVDES